jgi:hypothetical protein
MAVRARSSVDTSLLWLLVSSLAIAAIACKEDLGAESEAAVPPPAQAPRRPAPPSPALTGDEEATIEKVMAARDEIAAIAEARVRDCDAAAKEIEIVVERTRPLLAASSAMERDPAKHLWIGERYGARMLASSSKLMALMEHCDPHDGLSRIFESLE